MSQPLLFANANVLLGDQVIADAAVAVEDGTITAVGRQGSISVPEGALEIDARGRLLAPGLIDIQLNGGFGHDFTHEPETIWEVGARLSAFGVTSFVPTVVTSSAIERQSMLAVLAAGPPTGYRGATPLGVHFEGPFISSKASGAHDLSYLRLPVDAEADVVGWSKDAGVLIVTLAPELDGAIELTEALVARGVVVSAGHSAADRDQAVAGFDAGIRYVTHLFNAMATLGHREPGLAGAALADPRVTVGLIPDGIHVHPDVIRIAANAAGHGRVSVVTDATAALGMDPGQYVLGGRDVVLDGTSVRLSDDGRLAGSALTADEALRRFAEMSGWPTGPTIAAMTSVPARLLNLENRGVIRVGARADLVMVTPELRVEATFIGGQRWA
jgi:N-acetylglucosamine-6-phosphate deacetylase